MRKRLSVLVAVVLILLTAPSWAQIDPQGAPTTVTVQGKLTGSGGTPVSPGDYTFEFSIHTAAVGGMKVWPDVGTESHLITLQGDGLWTAYLGKDQPIQVRFADDTARWLEITVTPPVGLAETFGRVKFASAPFALEAGQLNGKTGLEYLAQAGDTVGGSLHFDRNGDGTLDARIHLSESNSAVLTLYQSGVQTCELTGLGYGQLDLSDDSGDRTARLSATPASGGCLFLGQVGGAPGGMDFVGGSATSGATLTMHNAGGSATINFDADGTGNDAAVLPNNAISALEERDEPGVASNTSDASVDLDGTVQTLRSRTITVPAAGYVLVIGTCEVVMSHSNGTPSVAQFGVSNVSGSFPSNQDVTVMVSSSAPTGPYVQAVTVHGLFSVSAGGSTFYLLGDEEYGAVWVGGDIQLTLAYFPTAYGDAVPMLAAEGQPAPDGDAQSGGAWTAQDIAAEQAEAERFNTARIERELATLREEVQALTERLRTEESAQRTREGDR